MLAALLFALALAGCATDRTARELRQFDGVVVPSAGAVPVLENARRALVTVVAQDSRGTTVGYGSGFYVASNQVATCLHVVDPATVIQIIGADGRPTPIAGIFAAEPSLDAAVLWVTNPPPAGAVLPIREAPAAVGEKVFALGAPDRLPIKQAQGAVVEVLDIGTQTLLTSLVLSVPVVPGFSGGPVLDPEGRVVGITGAISSVGTNRYSLAIPIELVVPLLEAEPTSLLAWRRKFPAPPYPAFVEASEGERAVNEDLEKALNHFERAILLAPDYARARVQKASCLLRLGRLDEAEKAYAKAAELAPTLPVPRLMRALCLHKLGRSAEAIDQLGEVLRLQPRALQPRLMLVSLLADRRDYAAALAEARVATAVAPEKAASFNALGTVLDNIGAPAGALAAFRRAAALAPDGLGAWSEISGLAAELDDAGLVREACGRILSAPPSRFTGGAEYLLALIARRSGDAAAASGHFTRALRFERQQAKGFKLPSAAIEALGILEGRGVGDASAHREMGGFFAKTGRMKEARAALEESVRLEPRDPRSWAGLAQICAGEWRDDRARDAALRAIALNRTERFANQALGFAEALSGRLAEARRALEAELKITGPNATTHLALAAIEARAGRPASSGEWFEKARQLDATLAGKFQNRVADFLPDATALRAEASKDD